MSVNLVSEVSATEAGSQKPEARKPETTTVEEGQLLLVEEVFYGAAEQATIGVASLIRSLPNETLGRKIKELLTV